MTSAAVPGFFINATTGLPNMYANPTMIEMENRAYLTMFAQNGTSPPASVHNSFPSPPTTTLSASPEAASAANAAPPTSNTPPSSTPMDAIVIAPSASAPNAHLRASTRANDDAADAGAAALSTSVFAFTTTTPMRDDDDEDDGEDVERHRRDDAKTLDDDVGAAAAPIERAIVNMKLLRRRVATSLRGAATASAAKWRRTARERDESLVVLTVSHARRHGSRRARRD